MRHLAGRVTRPDAFFVCGAQRLPGAETAGRGDCRVRRLPAAETAGRRDCRVRNLRGEGNIITKDDRNYIDI